MAETELIKVNNKRDSRCQEALETMELEAVILFFQSYLKDEVILKIKGQNQTSSKTKSKTKRRKAQRKYAKNKGTLRQQFRQNQLPVSRTDLLLVGVAAICERIIIKFANGQQPHHERMKLWEMCLFLVGEFVDTGVLGDGKEAVLSKGGVLFKCLVFAETPVGRLIVPLEIPTVRTPEEDNMPAMNFRQFFDLSKQNARLILLDYLSDVPFRFIRWHHVYTVQCADGTFYTGRTQDISACIGHYNAGKGSGYAKSRFPVRLIYWRSFNSEPEAAEWMGRLRGLKKDAKLKLIKAEVISAGYRFLVRNI